MSERNDAIRTIREALVKRKHYECEDGWYSCPMSTEGCLNESEDETCTCGASEHNALVDSALAALDKLAVEPSEDARDIAMTIMAHQEQWLKGKNFYTINDAAALITIRDERIRAEALREAADRYCQSVCAWPSTEWEHPNECECTQRAAILAPKEAHDERTE